MLSKQFSSLSRSLPVHSNPYKLNPWFVTGFIDASLNKFSKLVVWGTNLSSSVGKGKFSFKVNNMIKLPQDEKSVIIGLLLSDGWLSIF